MFVPTPRHPIFGLIMGSIMSCLCLICSKNQQLHTLALPANQIGDAGAASIGDALAYVQSRHTTFSILILYNLYEYWACLLIYRIHKGRYQGVILFVWQPKHVFGNIKSRAQSNR
jgi:hypothetical protein